MRGGERGERGSFLVIILRILHSFLLTAYGDSVSEKM